MTSPRDLMVIVYGKRDCGLCRAAAEKLDRMGLDYTVRDVELLVELHDCWRTDGTIEHSAWWDLLDKPVPLLVVRTSTAEAEATEKGYTYPQAMRVLKELLKRPALAAEIAGD